VLKPSTILTGGAARPLVSRNGERLRRFEKVLELLPRGCVFDGELVPLDDAGRPRFTDLLFGRGRPTYVAFDLLEAHGVDLRPLPLWERKAMLAALGKRAEGWIALTNGIVGDGRRTGRRSTPTRGGRRQASGRRLSSEARAVAQGAQSRLFSASRPRRMVFFSA
jgi:hypothetical protein